MARGHPSKKQTPRPSGSLKEQLSQAMAQAREQAGDSPEGRALDMLNNVFKQVATSGSAAPVGEKFHALTQPITRAFMAWLESAKKGDQFLVLGDKRTQFGTAARQYGKPVTIEMVAVVSGTKADPALARACLCTVVDPADETSRDSGADA